MAKYAWKWAVEPGIKETRWKKDGGGKNAAVIDLSAAYPVSHEYRKRELFNDSLDRVAIRIGRVEYRDERLGLF